MLTYLIKFILCSGFLFLFYKLFLERENMHKINRFYLIFALLFSIFAPFYKIEVPATVYSEKIPTKVLEQFLDNQTYKIEESFEWNYLNILLIIYGFVTFFLLLRFAYHLYQMNKKIRANEKINQENITYVVLEKNGQPFSFLSYIFVNIEHFDPIYQNLILHEKAHAKQKHSWDILLLEILTTLFWFNPFLYPFKKSIKLNHEFLADNYVLKFHKDVKSYQNQILEFLTLPEASHLASNFNFNLTKKRLLMMTKQTSTRKIGFLSFSFLPFFFLAFILFSQKNFAQKIDSASVKLEQKLEQNINKAPDLIVTESIEIPEETKQEISKQIGDFNPIDIKKVSVQTIGDEKMIVINDSIKVNLKKNKSPQINIKKDKVEIIEVDESVLKTMNPNQIRKIDVLKEGYEDGGVIIINDSIKIRKSGSQISPKKSQVKVGRIVMVRPQTFSNEDLKQKIENIDKGVVFDEKQPTKKEIKNSNFTLVYSYQENDTNDKKTQTNYSYSSSFTETATKKKEID